MKNSIIAFKKAASTLSVDQKITLISMLEERSISNGYEPTSAIKTWLMCEKTHIINSAKDWLHTESIAEKTARKIDARYEHEMATRARQRHSDMLADAAYLGHTF